MAEEGKELRKMSRAELIEIIYALQQQQRELQAERDALQARLDDRLIRLEEAGSIAEAALSVNEVFAAAQAAADQYTQAVKAQADRLLADTTLQCDLMRQEAQVDVDYQWQMLQAKALELSAKYPEQDQT